ncbi:hypothetical protein PPYR_06946 [Photinus pyralis]|uniref:CRAL-TRIO domain-containing protein n=2 Tax=Photinus pyralis TaxID=7054 RepID=A0A5N4AP31_PHOPY|nr:retinol-binding protein pinta-like [Photinus pyralis]KAB0799066.1 hypothetical protein PPYR_06946 [Photinus pyralis]
MEVAVRSLPKSMQLIAETELNESPNRVGDDIRAMINWIHSQPHLKARLEHQWILKFLRASKFSLERAKEKMDLFYTMRTIADDIFDRRDPYLPEIQLALNAGAVVPLPVVTGEPIRAIYQTTDVDPDLMSFESRIKLSCMFMDVLLEEYEEISICGLCLLIDSRGVTYKHVKQTTLHLLRKIYLCVTKAYPIRVKAIHVINMSSIALILKSLWIPLLSKKHQSKIFFYEGNGGDELYQHFPSNLLPPEYGGGGIPLSELIAQQKVKLESYSEWFINDQKYCSSEKDRPKDSPIINELFGLEGSFRRIEVD